jgi:hypothetical protein
MKHEFAAVFGRESAKIFDGLWRVRLDINHAVDFMLRNKEMQRSGDPEDKKPWDESYRTAFRHSKPEQDAVAQRVAALVAEVEDVCRPAIEARERQ